MRNIASIRKELVIRKGYESEKRVQAKTLLSTSTSLFIILTTASPEVFEICINLKTARKTAFCWTEPILCIFIVVSSNIISSSWKHLWANLFRERSQIFWECNLDLTFPCIDHTVLWGINWTCCGACLYWWDIT